MKLHNELDAVNGMLAKVSKELNKIQTEKQELTTINFVNQSFVFQPIGINKRTRKNQSNVFKSSQLLFKDGWDNES
jgi:hypothetical protein